MIPQDIVDKVLSSARVEEVIGSFKELKREGSNYKCLSPFTDEKTPSCIVSPSKNIWKDFSSSKGGNSISYLMQAEKMTFPEAIKWLGEKYGIEIEERKLSPIEKQALARREKMYEANMFAKSFFTSELISTENFALQYLYDRGYNEEIIDLFGLGYCDSQFDSFYKQAINTGYSEEILTEIGLVTSNGRNPFDVMKGRVVFPIHDMYGKTIAFGGRILEESTDKKQPKYRNIKESSLFDKSKTLYGLHLAKESIIHENNAYITEGYTDVISSRMKGVKNIVSSCGTALTKDQLKIVSRFTGTVTIFFDGDNAGAKATFKAIDMALELGLNPRVVKLPKEHDPDSISKEKNDLKLYLEESATDFVEYKCSFLNRAIKSDPNAKAKVIDNILDSIALIEDQVERELFTKKLSALTEISQTSISSSLGKKVFTKSKKLVSKSEDTAEKIKALIPEERILELLRTNGQRVIKFISKKDDLTFVYENNIKSEIVERLVHLHEELHYIDDFLEKVATCELGEDKSVTEDELCYRLDTTFFEVKRRIINKKIEHFNSDDMYLLQDLILRRNRINNMMKDD